jgi:hypothetical protein
MDCLSYASSWLLCCALLLLAGVVDGGLAIRVQVCLRPFWSVFDVLNSFDLCAVKVAALASGGIVAHPR